MARSPRTSEPHKYLSYSGLPSLLSPDASSLRCHLVQAAPGPLLSDVLMGSPILMGEDGASIAVGHGGFEFGIDPMAADDPELAMVSLMRLSLSLTHSLSV